MFGWKKPRTTKPPPDPGTPAVVVVGHCGLDGPALVRMASALPGVQAVRVNGDKDLAPYIRPNALLLVNRVLEGRFAADSGIDLIRQITSAEDAPRAMLVSNYDDAQAEAVDAGALPGFGKREMGSPAITQRIADALPSTAQDAR